MPKIEKSENWREKFEKQIKAGYKSNPEYVETKSKRVQLLVQPSLYEAVKAKAKAEGISTNEAIGEALRKYTEEETIEKVDGKKAPAQKKPAPAKGKKTAPAVAEEIAANGSAPLYQDGDMVTKARTVIEFDYSYTPTIKYEKEIISKKACIIC